MKDQLPLIRSTKSFIAGSVLTALPFLFFLLPGQALMGPLPAIYAALIILFLLPAALCLTAMVCGTGAAAVGLAAAAVAVGVMMGAPGLTLAGVYVLPVLAAFFAVICLEVPFKKGCLILIGMHAVGLSLVYALAQRMAGGDLYTVAGTAAADYLENWEMGDTMLYSLYSMGLIDLSSDLADSALQRVLGGYRLSAAARADMLLSVRGLITTLFRQLVPNLLVSQSILGGVCCMVPPLRFGFLAEEKRAFLRDDLPEDREAGPQKIRFPDLGMPPFSQWHLPRGIGWQVGVALAAGYFLRMSDNAVMNTAGALLYAGATSVFTIQGAATVNFVQKARGSRRLWRVVVPVLLHLVSLLTIIGIFDQISNFRRLRKPPEPKEDIL